MKRTLLTCLSLAMLAIPGLSFALSEQDKSDLHEFVAVQHMDEMWPQLYPKIASDTSRWVRQFAEADIDESAQLSQGQRARAKDMLDRFMPAAQDDLTAYLKAYDYRQLTDFLAVDVYGSLFEMSQIRQLTAFYQTSTGQKLLRETPAIMREMKAGDKSVMERHFTKPEIAAVMAFYQSPAEQRVQSTAPQVQARIKEFYEKKVEQEVHKLERQVVSQAVAAARE